LISAAAWASLTPFANIELNESIDAETSTSLTPLHEADELESIADATFLIAIASDATDDELLTFAATSNTPFPPRDENGD
jgi:hypothetical protein